MRASILIALALALSACARTIPAELERQIERGVSLKNLQQELSVHKGQTVLLGGELIDVKTRGGELTLEVLQRPLDSWNQPALLDASDGRFLIKLGEEIKLEKGYREGQPLTVVGEVTGDVETRAGAETPSPVLVARYLRLWSPADFASRSRSAYSDPYLYPPVIILRRR